LLHHRPQRDSEYGWIETTRDVVEIVAITLAGLWALYIFVYENRIKPAIAPPELSVSAQMERVGAHDGFAVVRVQTHIKNVGTVPAQFLGFSVTILGSRFLPYRPSVPNPLGPYVQEFRPFYSFTKPVVVYRWAYLTNATNPAIQADLRLNPGESSDKDTIVYAPMRAVDHLALYISNAYVKDTNHRIRTTLSYGPDGTPEFSVSSADARGVEVHRIEAQVAALDISSR
jgi:hypothetical protein